MRNWCCQLCLLISAVFHANAQAQPLTWVDLRDARLVPQQTDSTCGAASAATILKYFYSADVSEARLSELMGRSPDETKSTTYSFADIERAVNVLNFKAAGLELTYAQLNNLRVPAIAHLVIDGREHFAVIAGSDEHRVRLADPASGNSMLYREQFLNYWSRNNGGNTGRVLVIVPFDKDSVRIDPTFFGMENVRLPMLRGPLAASRASR